MTARPFFSILALVLFQLQALGQSAWSSQNPLPTGNHLSGVSFVTTNVGAAVGDCGTIIRTSDAGTTWTVQSSKTDLDLFGLHFLDQAVGIVEGDSGIVLRTPDGGSTWIRHSTGTTKSVSAVCMVDQVTPSGRHTSI